MPLHKWILTSLTKSTDTFCTIVLEHGLSGLDCLANEKLVHQDIKPDNVVLRLRARTNAFSN